MKGPWLLIDVFLSEGARYLWFSFCAFYVLTIKCTINSIYRSYWKKGSLIDILTIRSTSWNEVWEKFPDKNKKTISLKDLPQIFIVARSSLFFCAANWAMKKTTWLFRVYRDEIRPSYKWGLFKINHYKDPGSLNNQYFQWKVRGFLIV